ncbi:MAG: integrase [Saprospirales bacterium]|nr:MAG: integrase [Saprospirales bacterium]
MASIEFRVTNGKNIKDREKEYSIYLRFTLGRKMEFVKSINFKVCLNDWDQVKQRIRNRTHIHHRHVANELMDGLTIHFREWHNENLKKGITPTRKEAGKHFDRYFQAPEVPEKITLWDYIDNLIKSPETRRNLTGGSLRGYRLTKDFLLRFNNEVYRFDFEDISLDWYNDFVEWCEGQGLSKNYIGKHIKTLKTFLNRALEDKVTTNQSHKSRRFVTLREDTNHTYLNKKELAKIWELKLSGRPELARDLFLIGSWTGLRVSDFNKLTSENITRIDDIEYLKVKAQKTSKTVVIPLHPVVKSILKKYDGTPPRMPEQHINKHIKEVCKLAGITVDLRKEQTRGGKGISKKMEKYNLVTNHTARRSFCTNAYLSGLEPLDIMAISGHTSEKNFLKYIKATPEQKALKMASNEFFTGTALTKAQ